MLAISQGIFSIQNSLTTDLTAGATICLVIVGVLQATAAMKQAKAADRQAEAAAAQVAAAARQVEASEQQAKLSKFQLHQALGSADNSTMPQCHIAMRDGTSMKHGVPCAVFKVENKGMGPANLLRMGLYDPLSKSMAEETSEEVGAKFLGIGEEINIEVPMQSLRNPGVVIRYESMHRTVIEHLVTLTNREVDIRTIREDRPYAAISSD
jgi:hypothetical protein